MSKWANSTEALAAHTRAMTTLKKMRVGAFTFEEAHLVLSYLNAMDRRVPFAFDAEHPESVKLLTTLIDLSERTIGV